MNLLKKEGVDLGVLTPEEIEEMLAQRRATAAATTAAQVARRAARRQVLTGPLYKSIANRPLKRDITRALCMLVAPSSILLLCGALRLWLCA